MATRHRGGSGLSESGDYKELQRQHRADAQSLLPEYVDRLSWPANRLRGERQDRLRELVQVAKGWVEPTIRLERTTCSLRVSDQRCEWLAGVQLPS